MVFKIKVIPLGNTADYFQLEGEIAQRQFCTLHAIQLACFGNHYAGQDN